MNIEFVSAVYSYFYSHMSADFASLQADDLIQACARRRAQLALMIESVRRAA